MTDRLGDKGQDEENGGGGEKGGSEISGQRLEEERVVGPDILHDETGGATGRLPRLHLLHLQDHPPEHLHSRLHTQEGQAQETGSRQRFRVSQSGLLICVMIQVCIYFYVPTVKTNSECLFVPLVLLALVTLGAFPSKR